MLSNLTKSTIGNRVIITGLSCLSLPIALIYTSYAIQNKPLPEVVKDIEIIPLVTVTKVLPSEYSASIQVYGEARPQFELSLLSEVEGKVNNVSTLLSRGSRLSSNIVLAKVDETSYLEKLASAEQTLSEAQLNLLQEQQEAAHAKDEWFRSSISKNKPDPLLLREPQLAVALSKLNLAKATVTKAQRDLQNTNLSVPFEAIVAQRHISPGQYLRVGDEIATLYSLARMDIKVSLAKEHWQLLPEETELLGYKNLTIKTADGNEWQGEITQVDKHIDPKVRQRNIVVSVFNPLEGQAPLLAGTFVEVTFRGEAKPELLSVPASSLTSKNTIWYIGNGQTLRHFEPVISFQQDGRIFFQAPNFEGYEGGEIEILVSPLTSYFSGQRVIPDSFIKGSS